MSNCSLVLQERRRLALIHIPPIRTELIVSPYPQFTKKELDMRRKVEVLKYSNNTQNSKTNEFTKSEIWSHLVNGKNRNYSQFIKTNTCPDDYIIPTSTSSSGIPGPPIILKFDPNIPLYN
jgi:hypothetical protein